MDVFEKLDRVNAVLDPFPYVVVENVLPDQVCDALLREMPPLSVLTHGEALRDNKRFNFSHADAMTARGVSPLWQDVLSQAISQQFLDRILRIFGPSIPMYYPDFEERFGPLGKLTALPRSQKQSPKAEQVMLDAQIATNTPAVTGGTSVRPAHLDRTDKLFIGLLYLRMPDDDSKGADLELLKPIPSEGPLVYGHQRMLPREKCALVRTVPYRKNTLVLFLNTATSLHAVTPRQATPHTRYFINLVGEMREPLFEVEVKQPVESRPGFWGRLWNGVAGEKGARPAS